MNSIAILLVLGSAVMHALRNFLTKTSFDKQVFMWCYQVVSLIIFLPVFLYFLITIGIGIQ